MRMNENADEKIKKTTFWFATLFNKMPLKSDWDKDFNPIILTTSKQNKLFYLFWIQIVVESTREFFWELLDKKER